MYLINNKSSLSTKACFVHVVYQLLVRYAQTCILHHSENKCGTNFNMIPRGASCEMLSITQQSLASGVSVKYDKRKYVPHNNLNFQMENQRNGYIYQHALTRLLLPFYPVKYIFIVPLHPPSGAQFDLAYKFQVCFQVLRQSPLAHGLIITPPL